MTYNRLRSALLFALCTVAGAGCGLEAVGSAATGAAVKKQEIDNNQAQKEAIQQQLRDLPPERLARLARLREAAISGARSESGSWP